MSSAKWRPFCVSLNVMLMWCHCNGVIRVCLVSSKSVWYQTYILVVFHAILQFTGHLYNYNGVKIKYGTTKLKLSLMIIFLTTSFTLMNELLLEANALSNKWQAITWTNADLVYRCIYVSLCLDKFMCELTIFIYFLNIIPRTLYFYHLK